MSHWRLSGVYLSYAKLFGKTGWLQGIVNFSIHQMSVTWYFLSRYSNFNLHFDTCSSMSDLLRPPFDGSLSKRTTTHLWCHIAEQASMGYLHFLPSVGLHTSPTREPCVHMPFYPGNLVYTCTCLSSTSQRLSCNGLS